MTRLFITIAVLALVAWWARRAERRTTGGRGGIRVTSRAGIARGCGVAVVEVDDRRFLLGWGQQGTTSVAELDPQPSPAPDEAAPASGTTEPPAPPAGPSGVLDRLRQLTTITPKRDLR